MRVFMFMCGSLCSHPPPPPPVVARFIMAYGIGRIHSQIIIPLKALSCPASVHILYVQILYICTEFTKARNMF